MWQHTQTQFLLEPWWIPKALTPLLLKNQSNIYIIYICTHKGTHNLYVFLPFQGSTYVSTTSFNDARPAQGARSFGNTEFGDNFPPSKGKVGKQHASCANSNFQGSILYWMRQHRLLASVATAKLESLCHTPTDTKIVRWKYSRVQQINIFGIRP